MSEPNRRSESGFTLVEALVAIVILIFGLMAVTNLFLVAANSNTVANQQTASAALASQTLEMLKTLPFVSIGGGDSLDPGGSLTSDTTGFFAEQIVPGVGTIRTRWQVSAVPGQAQLRYIVVRSEAVGAFMGARTRAEFATLRSCTAPMPDTTGSCPSGSTDCCPAAP